MKRILHADLDAFYASVEQRDRPELRGKAMAVGGGVILAASYPARRLGVKTAMNEAQARRLCPELLVVPPRMDAYAEASKAVFEIFEDTTPNVEPLSIDEAFLDVTGLQRLEGSDRTIALKLRRRVAEDVGLALSIGAASTKFLAKVASAVCKPDGLLVVDEGGELAFLHPLPVSRLWGVGPVTTEALAELGIHTVGEVAELGADLLASKLGTATGHHLHALANNHDPRPIEVRRRRRSIGSQRSFRAGTVDRDGAQNILLDVVDRVARRLRAADRVGRTVVVRIRLADFSNLTRSRTLVESTNETALILETATELLDVAWVEIAERGLTKVGIAVSGLGDDSAVQLSLPFTKHNHQQLDAAVDDIRQRFGVDSMKRAPLVGTSSQDMPMLPD